MGATENDTHFISLLQIVKLLHYFLHTARKDSWYPDIQVSSPVVLFE